MSVQFILGANPTSKRNEMIDRIYDHIEENPQAKMIYLVPDNVKYEAEIMVLEQFKKNSGKNIAGMIDLQIFSFSRLAWYLLQDQAIYQQAQLTESGLAMLLTKILKEEETELTIYRGASQESGFIQRLITLFSEFRNGKIDPDDLESILLATESETAGVDFQRKIEDITHIYKKYDQALMGSYLEREDLYKELIRHIEEEATNFKETTIYVDHYEHFSAQELELLTLLAKKSKRLMISLTLAPEAFGNDHDYNNLFYRPLKSYYQLKETFEGEGIKVLENFFSEEHAEVVNELAELRNYWIESNQVMTEKVRKNYRKGSYEAIELWETEDMDAEILHIASKIKEMVATEHYRYKDFQIMTRNLASYELSIKAIFKENELPFFIDEKETMAQHPLLEFLVSLFSLKKRYFRLDDIFRFLRTELFLPGIDALTLDDDSEEALQENLSLYQEKIKNWREQIDVAENVALAFGYQGADWTRMDKWQYSRFNLDEQSEQTDAELAIEAEANEVRELFREKIASFIKSLDKIETNYDLAIALYNFMEKIGVMKSLDFWRSQLVADGQLEAAEQHEQAWGTFVSLLDEFVELLGDEAWDLDSFLAIIESGFEEASYSMVPPTIDQVLITNYDLPKIQAKKIVFLIGLTDTALPEAQENQSLLTDEDREFLEASLTNDKYLAVSGMESMANEPFGFYLAISQASEKIFFTYSSTNSEHKENRMSPYLARIQEALKLPSHVKYGNAISLSKELASPFDYLHFLASKDQAFGQLVISLRYALDESMMPSPFWTELFNQLYNPENLRQQSVLKSLSHRNIPVPLNEELAEELYGKDLHLSVSQLESFYTDPYSHFLIYGLGLRERQLQELTPLESGNFYHEALDLISQELISSRKDLAQITEYELDQITRDIFNHLLDLKKYRLANSSHRMNFIFRQLSKTVKNMVHSLIQQSKRTKFRPAKTELVFGQLGNQKGVQGLNFDLTGNRKLFLRGKIDRVDSFKEKDQLFAGVVDYKSSDTNFNYQNIYHGLMLQMVTYLDTVLTYSREIFGEDALGIGAFYSTITNYYTDLQKLAKKDLALEQLKEYKYKGLIVHREEILEAADLLLEAKETSPVYPVRLLKSGNYTEVGTLSEEELEWLIRFNREKIIEAGNKIISGKNSLYPYDRRQSKIFTPAVDGPYRAISQFDALLKENNYREIESMNEKEFFERLKNKYANEKEDKS